LFNGPGSAKPIAAGRGSDKLAQDLKLGLDSLALLVVVPNSLETFFNKQTDQFLTFFLRLCWALAGQHRCAAALAHPSSQNCTLWENVLANAATHRRDGY